MKKILVGMSMTLALTQFALGSAFAGDINASKFSQDVKNNQLGIGIEVCIDLPIVGKICI